MLKAFDTILQTEVTASLAAKNGGFEQYRYECSCCGEEAYVAAPFSIKQSAHFRHRNGNNDVECENYLGQFGMLSAGANSKKSNRERAEFYFDYASKMFYIGIRFTGHEIRGYEEHDVDLELRTRELGEPFKTIKINALNFAPDVPTMIPLTAFSYNYYLSNTGNDLKRRYGFFNRSTPTFFKILGNEDMFKARLLRSDCVYTNTRYFVVFQSQWSVYTVFDGMEISEAFRFDTMGHRLAGVIVKIHQKTEKIVMLIKSWGYQLEESETLTLLWPPVSECEDISKIDSDTIFLHTSFSLHAHGNINVSPSEIKRLSEDVTKIRVNDRVRIYRKNAEIYVVREKRQENPYDLITTTTKYADKFTVSNDKLYFIVNGDGTMPLTVGQNVFLTRHSQIKGYVAGYLCELVRPLQHNELSGIELLRDILSHSKRTEPFFDIACFDSLSLSNIAMEYIFECESSMKINSIAKHYILEGKL